MCVLDIYKKETESTQEVNTENKRWVQGENGAATVKKQQYLLVLNLCERFIKANTKQISMRCCTEAEVKIQEQSLHTLAHALLQT